MSALRFLRLSSAIGKNRAAKNTPQKVKSIRDARKDTELEEQMKEALSLSSGETGKRREHSSVTELCGISYKSDSDTDNDLCEFPPPKNGVLTQNVYAESAEEEHADFGEEFDDTASLVGNSSVQRESRAGWESSKLGEVTDIGSISNTRNTGDRVTGPNLVSPVTQNSVSESAERNSSAKPRPTSDLGEEGEEENLFDGEEDDECGFTNAFLRRLEKTQTSILSRRAALRNSRTIKKKRSRHFSGSAVRDPRMRMKQHWENYLETLSTSFFNSREARLEHSERVTKGRPAYQGVLVTPQNNPDMKCIYEISWKSREDLGQPMGTFEQFRVVVGQYARFAIASGMFRPSQLCKKGTLCDALCSLPAVQAFIRYFEIRSAAGTVMNKAFHLLRLARYATTYFTERNCSVQQGQIQNIIEYLKGVARVFKSESRRQASLRKEEEARDGSGLYLQEGDMVMFANKSVDELNDLIHSAKRAFREGGNSAVEEFLLSDKKIINKWNLNFLSALMFHGGGQRPQVYALLEAPSSVDLVSMVEDARKNGVFHLRLSFEKRARYVDLPNVIFPRVLYRPVKFHVNHVLPTLYKKHGIEVEDPRRKCLLLHTETGDSLDTRHVTASIRAFLKRFDPDLAKVSSMTLRASYATMMLLKYRRGETMGDLTEEKFIEYLAKLMNTSCEQLRETYISSEGGTFKVCAEMISGIMDRNGPISTANNDLELF